MEKYNAIARHYESKFDNLKLENGRNREIVKAAFKNMQDNYDKLKEDNALLIDALKEIIELFPNEPKLPISHQVLDISKSALQKVENK